MGKAVGPGRFGVGQMWWFGLEMEEESEKGIGRQGDRRVTLALSSSVAKCKDQE
ncbi:unnamed protein product [Linum tenue]|uniref:Uncharacterized protein n=1 Tax=Linum tenue TaxID=586396 RepID=A0AAV0J974_9ROSI|nr:unnamed protein product [Linum tenue]